MARVARGIDDEADRAMGQARGAYRAGDRAAADRHCRAALQIDPSLAEAIYLLGVIAMDGGHSEAALARFRQASQLRPDVAPFHNALGEAYRALGRSAEAAVAPLFDTARFVRNLERAYQSMWDAFTRGHKGEVIGMAEY